MIFWHLASTAMRATSGACSGAAMNGESSLCKKSRTVLTDKNCESSSRARTSLSSNSFATTLQALAPSMSDHLRMRDVSLLDDSQSRLVKPGYRLMSIDGRGVSSERKRSSGAGMSGAVVVVACVRAGDAARFRREAPGSLGVEAEAALSCERKREAMVASSSLERPVRPRRADGVEAPFLASRSRSSASSKAPICGRKTVAPPSCWTCGGGACASDAAVAFARLSASSSALPPLFSLFALLAAAPAPAGG